MRHRGEQRLVEALVPEAPVEALDEAVLHRLARRDVVPFDLPLLGPSEDRAGGELRAVVAHQHRYVLAANSELDGREMPLREAFDAIIGMGDGALVSCIPGRLGLYEYEDIKSSYLLSR